MNDEDISVERIREILNDFRIGEFSNRYTNEYLNEYNSYDYDYMQKSLKDISKSIFDKYSYEYLQKHSGDHIFDFNPNTNNNPHIILIKLESCYLVNTIIEGLFYSAAIEKNKDDIFLGDFFYNSCFENFPRIAQYRNTECRVEKRTFDPEFLVDRNCSITRSNESNDTFVSGRVKRVTYNSIILGIAKNTYIRINISDISHITIFDNMTIINSWYSDKNNLFETYSVVDRNRLKEFVRLLIGNIELQSDVMMRNSIVFLNTKPYIKILSGRMVFEHKHIDDYGMGKIKYSYLYNNSF